MTRVQAPNGARKHSPKQSVKSHYDEIFGPPKIVHYIRNALNYIEANWSSFCYPATQIKPLIMAEMITNFDWVSYSFHERTNGYFTAVRYIRNSS